MRSLLKTESLLNSTQRFFQNYLRQTQARARIPVRAYRDALKLFFLFLADRARPIAGLGLDRRAANTVLAFLEHIRNQRGNSAVTRNCRLALLTPPCGALCSMLLPTRRDPRRAIRRDRNHRTGNPRAVLSPTWSRKKRER